MQDLSRCEDSLSTLKEMQAQSSSPQLELDITRLEKEIEVYSQEKLCYEAQILRVDLPFCSWRFTCYFCKHMQLVAIETCV